MFDALLFLATLFLAYSNGANDNFKGVATLFGSGTSTYRNALTWATLTTLLGSFCAIFIARELVENFSGKGLVPDATTQQSAFLFAVGLGAALTVLKATLFGFPISTTHALLGGLVGAGFVAVGTDLNVTKLSTAFLLPLLLTPLIAILGGAVVYWFLHRVRIAFGLREESCLCVDIAPNPCELNNGHVIAAQAHSTVEVALASTENCVRRYQYKKSVFGIACQSTLDHAHYLSAGAVCFARGLNDTPKIVALLFLMPALSLTTSMSLLALSMAIGGLLSARKVAATLSQKITPMNHGQGFTANFATASILLCASIMSLPVSTTHVSVGAITGVGVIAKNAQWNKISQIALSWLLTLPIAAIFSAAIYAVIR